MQNGGRQPSERERCAVTCETGGRYDDPKGAETGAVCETEGNSHPRGHGVLSHAKRGGDDPEEEGMGVACKTEGNRVGVTRQMGRNGTAKRVNAERKEEERGAHGQRWLNSAGYGSPKAWALGAVGESAGDGHLNAWALGATHVLAGIASPTQVRWGGKPTGLSVST
ncbi:LOW QUALITY PROTEIN: hypothetical protein CVT25_010496 [Psilocybe cyanescens]|uniref:Uncharacterized protein n=1 Tax=Psilocybe cyanescens TaxID=93625 RepID=A0A409WDH3_PSICY|nr:LOW QUALITY PROTEIN: hypothetical protein CVT25_010496 [Psilocybe cyanescens]